MGHKPARGVTVAALAKGEVWVTGRDVPLTVRGGGAAPQGSRLLRRRRIRFGTRARVVGDRARFAQTGWPGGTE
jgi:hypothetical protein